MRVPCYLGLVRAELYFRGARTLKDRRGHLRSLKDRLSNLGFSVSQVGPSNLVQQAWVAAVIVSGSRARVLSALDRADRLFQDPEWELSALEKDIISDGEQLPDWETV
ncbi:MAG: DUF503 family protein [Candidatus Fermentibacteraceae bacterium]|nr:DUF503 family protein [Candidatus Fermentibacteraceae bacterium]MBN2608818.1 DUF503 family protein [Candidatus Fermentibacteraceae bacterium]